MLPQTCLSNLLHICTPFILLYVNQSRFSHLISLFQKNNIIEKQLAVVVKAEYTRALQLAILVLRKCQQKHVYTFIKNQVQHS